MEVAGGRGGPKSQGSGERQPGGCGGGGVEVGGGRGGDLNLRDRGRDRRGLWWCWWWCWGGWGSWWVRTRSQAVWGETAGGCGGGGGGVQVGVGGGDGRRSQGVGGETAGNEVVVVWG